MNSNNGTAPAAPYVKVITVWRSGSTEVLGYVPALFSANGGNHVSMQGAAVKEHSRYFDFTAEHFERLNLLSPESAMAAWEGADVSGIADTQLRTSAHAKRVLEEMEAEEKARKDAAQAGMVAP